MVEIRTVLCPVDFSPLCERELALATEVCRRFGARLVLHHNLDAVSVGLSMGWMWNQVHAGEAPTEAEVEAKLRELLARLPVGIPAEARLSNGPVPAALGYLQQQTAADLLILGTHGASTEDHASVAARVIEEALCPVVVLHESETGPCPWPRDAAAPLRVLVPVDWTAGSRAAMTYAFNLARELSLDLHLLHVVPEPKGGGEPAEADLAAERSRLEGVVPADLRERVLAHVVAGEADPAILAEAERLGAAWIVMGTHGRGLFRRFSHDTAQALLHRACCPVWYVPASYAEA